MEYQKERAFNFPDVEPFEDYKGYNTGADTIMLIVGVLYIVGKMLNTREIVREFKLSASSLFRYKMTVETRD